MDGLMTSAVKKRGVGVQALMLSHYSRDLPTVAAAGRFVFRGYKYETRDKPLFDPRFTLSDCPSDFRAGSARPA
jgi:hypothetical protein